MNLKQLTYRKKNKLLLFGALLFVIIAYLLPVKKTIDAYKEYRGLQKKLSVAKEAPLLIDQTEQQLENYKKLLRSVKVDSLKQEEFILDQVSRACQQFGVTIVAFAPPDKYTSNEYRLNNRIVRIRGPYKKIVQVIDALENKYSVGRLASIRFVLEEEHWKRTSDLFAYLYIQNIQTVDNEGKTTDF